MRTAGVHADAETPCEVPTTLSLCDRKEHFALPARERRDLMRAETLNEYVVERSGLTTFGERLTDGCRKAPRAGDCQKRLRVPEPAHARSEKLISSPQR